MAVEAVAAHEMLKLSGVSTTVADSVESGSVIRNILVTWTWPVKSDPSATFALPHAVVPALQRRSVMPVSMPTSVSSTPPGLKNTVTRTSLKEFATAPLASGVPTVTALDRCAGGLHDGKASGGPCMRLSTVHWLKAGTRLTRSGVAPRGRG